MIRPSVKRVPGLRYDSGRDDILRGALLETIREQGLGAIQVEARSPETRAVQLELGFDASEYNPYNPLQ